MHTKQTLEAELVELKQRTKALEGYLTSETCRRLPKLAQQLYSERLRIQLRLEQCVAAILRQYDNPPTESP